MSDKLLCQGEVLSVAVDDETATLGIGSGCSSLAENTPCGEQQLVPHPDDMENDGLAVLTGNEQGLLETGYLVGERCVALAVQATFADGYKALVGRAGADVFAKLAE